jgi:hypothetical protein
MDNSNLEFPQELFRQIEIDDVLGPQGKGGLADMWIGLIVNCGHFGNRRPSAPERVVFEEMNALLTDKGF